MAEMANRRTLTEMLLNSYMPMDEEQRKYAKEVFKKWLGEVGLPTYSTPESVRRLLITLVDEP